MLAMPSQIEIFEEMSALSARMVTAAQTHDWQALVELEKSVAVLRNAVMAEDGNASLSPAELDMKRALIQRILDDDAEIRRHTEPWMEQVRHFLGGAHRRRRVESAYGATA
jgi:flagellar protein FliT